MEQLSLLFNEAEVYVDQAAEEDDGSVAVAAHKRHKKHEYIICSTVEIMSEDRQKCAHYYQQHTHCGEYQPYFGRLFTQKV